MRLFFPFLLCFLLHGALMGQTMPPYPRVLSIEDESVAPDSVRERFREDALRLATGWLNERKLNREDFVEIPDTLVASFYQGLIRCWLAATEQERLVIRNSPAMWVELRSLYLAISSDSSRWISAWKKDRKKSGNIEADRIMAKFGLTAQTGLQFQSSSSTRFNLQSDHPINVQALGYILAAIPGVVLDVADREMSDIFCQGKPLSPLIVEQKGIRWHFRFCTDCEDPYYDRRAVVFDVIVDGQVKRPTVE